MKPLTESEQKLLYFLEDKNNWRAPKYETMRLWLKYKSDGHVGYIIKKLKEKGYIDKDNRPLKHSEDNVN